MNFARPYDPRSWGFLFGEPGITGRRAAPLSREESAMDTVRIFDTTLRDGEQSPGATLNLQEKVEIRKVKVN